MTLDQIEAAVRAQNSHWAPFFRSHGTGWHCILYPRHILTEEEYQALAARLSDPVKAQRFTTSERVRNALRHRAGLADEGGGRYGR
jgi:hypothetical protein